MGDEDSGEEENLKGQKITFHSPHCVIITIRLAQEEEELLTPTDPPDCLKSLLVFGQNHHQLIIGKLHRVEGEWRGEGEIEMVKKEHRQSLTILSSSSVSSSDSLND